MSSEKKALITGVAGQDGSYLSELLISKGYNVYGIVRASATQNLERIKHLLPNDSFHLVYGDVTDAHSISQLARKIEPDEVYNLAAQSHVRVSFDVSEYTCNVGGIGTLRVLEALRSNQLDAKFYQASSSEMFGKVRQTPQNENTPFYPRSPYGVAKVFGYWITVNYRESYDMFAINGILFNHESPRRGNDFVTKKISLGLANILQGRQDKIVLGNINAKRDWGYAEDYVEAMYMMMQHGNPEDFVIATGETHSVREFLEIAFNHAGMDVEWRGSGMDEKAYDRRTGKAVVEIDPRHFRPSEVDVLVGDATKARSKLGWKPRVTFKELVKIMLDHDIEMVKTSGR